LADCIDVTLAIRVIATTDGALMTVFNTIFSLTLF